MKRLLLISLSALSCLLLSGCSNDSTSNESEKIPETLIVNADLPENVPSHVSTYKVSYKNFDSDEMLEIFHMKPVSFRDRDALGQRYESSDSLLYLYDDDGVLYGGFSYTEEMSSYAPAVLLNYYDSHADLMKEKPADDFSDTEALSFFNQIGLEQLRIDKVYELSGEELLAYWNSSDDFPDNLAEQEAEKSRVHPDDTYSLVFFSQFLDDIPLISFPWGIAGETQTFTEAQAVVFEDRIVDNRFVQLYNADQEISNDKIISPEKAFHTFVTDYNQKIQLDTTTITNISLEYVVTTDKDSMYAQPAYIFEYEYKIKYENSQEESVVQENKVISAINGAFILSTEVKT